jgi:hypothetical protein
MPLIVIDGTVKYRRPKKHELPIIGRSYQDNELYRRKEREKQSVEMSIGMSLLQEALLKGKKDV